MLVCVCVCVCAWVPVVSVMWCVCVCVCVCVLCVCMSFSVCVLLDQCELYSMWPNVHEQLGYSLLFSLLLSLLEFHCHSFLQVMSGL